VNRFWLRWFLALSVLIVLSWATAANAPQQSSPQTQSVSQANPPEKQSSDKKEDNPTAALITAIAALVAAVGGIILGVISANTNKRHAQQISQATIAELLMNFDQFEAGMRMVLTTKPQSEGLWEVIFTKIGSDDNARKKVAEALVWGISNNPNIRIQLQGLLNDDSKAVRVYPTVSSTRWGPTHPELSDEQIDQVQRIWRAAVQVVQSSAQTGPRPGEKEKG
jgi:hypothetical protein